MKFKFLILLFVAYTLPTFGAERPKPFQVIRLDALKPDPQGCDVKWRTFVNQMVWTDDDHVAVWLIYFCDSRGAKDQKAPTEIAIFDTTGHSHSVWSGFTFGFLPGPSGTLMVGQRSEVDLLGQDLRNQQTLKCPREDAACSIFVPKRAPSNSDFALCSYTRTAEGCDYYQGLPSKMVLQRELNAAPSNGIPVDPYELENLQTANPTLPNNRHAWNVGSSERWYFDDHGRLTSLDSKRQAVPVSAEKWTPDSGNCTGDLSVAKPFRFLATCVGAHVYTDGEFDALFGYSRIALFEVASRQILARIDGPAYTSASLSPSGKLIAVEHEGKIRLYRVD